MDLKISYYLTATILIILPIIIVTDPNLAFSQEAKKEGGMRNNTSIDSIGISQITTSIPEWVEIDALTLTKGYYCYLEII